MDVDGHLASQLSAMVVYSRLLLLRRHACVCVCVCNKCVTYMLGVFV